MRVRVRVRAGIALHCKAILCRHWYLHSKSVRMSCAKSVVVFQSEKRDFHILVFPFSLSIFRSTHIQTIMMRSSNNLLVAAASVPIHHCYTVFLVLLHTIPLNDLTYAALPTLKCMQEGAEEPTRTVPGECVIRACKPEHSFSSPPHIDALYFCYA